MERVCLGTASISPTRTRLKRLQWPITRLAMAPHPLKAAPHASALLQQRPIPNTSSHLILKIVLKNLESQNTSSHKQLDRLLLIYNNSAPPWPPSNSRATATRRPGPPQPPTANTGRRSGEPGAYWIIVQCTITSAWPWLPPVPPAHRPGVSLQARGPACPLD